MILAPCYTRTMKRRPGVGTRRRTRRESPTNRSVMLFMHVPAASANASASTA